MVIAAAESAVTTGTVIVTFVIGLMFRRSAIRLRDEYKGGEAEFRFWHG